MKKVNVAQRTLYDIRGADGTGTSANPVTSGANVKTYTVRKLADGNCWMTENLALPLVQGVPVEASYGTTTASSISTFTYTPTSDASIGITTVTPRTEAGSGSGGDGVSNWQGYYYYNWLAATAEKGTTSTAANVDVDGSICPRGWRLPANYSVDTIRSWGALTNTYLNITTNTATNTGYLTLESSPIYLQRSGDYRTGTFSRGGVYGYYWSSTSQSTSYAYVSYYGATSIDPQGGSGKATMSGYSLRCLAVR